ncbi:MAG TPA: RsmE family RNA methyltransferase [Actinomycetota bacterium]|nr:RsmE family RNA methyltransferase [Actinomycetota bacterium]
MSAPHFFVPSLAPGVVRLSAIDSRHALRSLRMAPGEELTLADGRGAVARGHLVGEEGGLAVVQVVAVSARARPRPPVAVALAPPKGERLTWAVQKLAELGVEEVLLVRARRSVREFPPERAGRLLERLRTVAREAAMQSRQAFVTEVREGGELDAALLAGQDLVVLLWEETSTPLREVLPPEPSGVRLVVGPEGGFGAGEVERAVAAGAVPASLGSAVLRTETAAVVGAALVLARYGRLG